MDEKTRAKIEELKAKIVPVLEKYPIKRAGLFGSVVRGEDTQESDVDILVEIKPRISYSDYFDLCEQLENGVNKKIDIIQYDLIKPALKEYILPTEIRIYEKNS